jgi:hypothetical protein
MEEEMPNIELHGYSKKYIATVLNRIRMALGDMPDAKEIVTTTYPDSVAALDGTSSPYLRVVSTPDGLGDLLKRLEPLREDIEVLLLQSWIPKT